MSWVQVILSSLIALQVRSFAGSGLRDRPQIVKTLFLADILDHKER